MNKIKKIPTMAQKRVQTAWAIKQRELKEKQEQAKNDAK